ncbi:MAG: hypothetical protein EP319_00065 [Deltaproteobacteria bacterium]|nr:MAG: hypothetical protein EP319_00065 [Deltaproteobacteria bacterium]
MNKSLPISSENGIQSIEEKLQERIDKIKKTYRIRYILLSTCFIFFYFVSNMSSNKVKEPEKQKVWKELTLGHQKIILPVIPYIDKDESLFPIEVDIYGEGKKALITKAILHSLKKEPESPTEFSSAYIEIPKEQLSKIPQEHGTLMFKLYPHMNYKKTEGKSYEVVF